MGLGPERGGVREGRGYGGAWSDRGGVREDGGQSGARAGTERGVVTERRSQSVNTAFTTITGPKTPRAGRIINLCLRVLSR